MPKKPLPQFNSFEEAKEFYSKYGRLEYFGRVGQYRLYVYHVNDGRKLRLLIYNDGRVEDYEDVLKRLELQNKE